MSDAISPFTVDIPQQALDDLQTRLALTRWPDAETCNGWDQGIPLAYTRELATYWEQQYDCYQPDVGRNGAAAGRSGISSGPLPGR